MIITTKFPKISTDREGMLLFTAAFSPASYIPEMDLIIITKKLTDINSIEILSHEFLHKILYDIDGIESCEKVDCILL